MLSVAFEVTGVYWSAGVTSRNISGFPHQSSQNKNLKHMHHFHWCSDDTRANFWEDGEWEIACLVKCESHHNTRVSGHWANGAQCEGKKSGIL